MGTHRFVNRKAFMAGCALLNRSKEERQRKTAPRKIYTVEQSSSGSFIIVVNEGDRTAHAAHPSIHCRTQTFNFSNRK